MSPSLDFVMSILTELLSSPLPVSCFQVMVRRRPNLRL